MDWVGAAQGLAWVGAAITDAIALICLPNPARGLVVMTHHMEQLPQVMLDRYIAFFGFSLFVALYGDLTVLAAWAAVLAFMACADTVIYARIGKPFARHLSAGIAALVVLAVALIAMISNGAA
ncbi:hypothetical protein [Pseudorhodobacter ferrugineus]|uniref:hypothetical protein n=1 Tax=Pseudorhodobacter ferrugineus TaxID=77008 RepID=UPI0003B567B4|nr:hypothetical protein [Pseudorhodobacter ferrugineus]